MNKTCVCKGEHTSYSGNSKEILLTLFTSFKGTSDRINIQTNTILNWAQFIPDIQPIVYTESDNGTLLDRAKEHGWKVFKVPRANEYGTPFLKDMFFDAERRFKSKWYGFANADIMFNNALLSTLKAVTAHLDELSTTVVIGKRTNVPMNPEDTTPFYKSDEISAKAKATGKLFSCIAIDYFLFSPLLDFPWDKVVDVVIGRPFYDHYLISVANLNNITRVDATRTVLAFHQTGKDGTFSGFSYKDSSYNKNLIGNKTTVHLGCTDRAPFMSYYDQKQTVQLRHKNKNNVKKHIVKLKRNTKKINLNFKKKECVK